MTGLFDTEMQITLLFCIYHGFLTQQFRILLNCFIYSCINKSTFLEKYLKELLI